MSFGFDPEVPAGYQDADIEMMELAEAANEGFYGDGPQPCEYRGCNKPAYRQGACERHYRQEQREMEEARRR